MMCPERQLIGESECKEKKRLCGGRLVTASQPFLFSEIEGFLHPFAIHRSRIRNSLFTNAYVSL